MEQQSSSSSSHANNNNNSGHGGELEAASSNDVNNHNHTSNNNNKHPTAAAKSTVTMRKMPNDYRWFTASCSTNLPITTTTDNNHNVGGRIIALERNSLIDRCPTPEVQERIVEIAVKEDEGEGGGDDVNNNVKKEDEGSVAIELSSALALSMEGTKEEEEVVDKSNKVGEDVDRSADMEIDESTVLASNNLKKESSDTTHEQSSMEIDSSTEPEHRDAYLNKTKAKEPNEQPSSTNVSAAATERSSNLPNDNASSVSMLPAKGVNSATALSNEKEPSLSQTTLSVTNQQTNETKKTNNESSPSNASNEGIAFDMAIASPTAAGTTANPSYQMGRDESRGIAVDSDKNTAIHNGEPVAGDDKDGCNNNASGTAAVDQPPPPYTSKRARRQTNDDDDIGDDSIDKEKAEDSDKPKSGSNAHAPAIEGSSLNEITVDEKSSDVVDEGGGNNDVGESNNTQSEQQLKNEEKTVSASTVAAATESSRTTSRRSTRKRKAAS